MLGTSVHFLLLIKKGLMGGPRNLGQSFCYLTAFFSLFKSNFLLVYPCFLDTHKRTSDGKA